MFTLSPVTLLSNTANLHIDIFGSLGLCLGFASGMMRARHRILLTSAACAVCFSLHFAALGAMTGATMCAISILQSLVAAAFIGPGRRAPFVAPLFAATSLVAGALTLATWAGWPSACAGIGALLATTARLQGDAGTMRLFFIGASACWFVHNSLVGSVFGLTCDLVTMLGLGIATLRSARTRPAWLGRPVAFR